MKRGVLAVVAFLLVGSSLASAQSDPRIGTWKVNLAKSTYDPGPAPKNDYRKYEATADGTKATVETMSATGSSIKGGYTARIDGKDYPTNANPNWDTVALKRIDSHTIEITLKKAGKVVQTIRSVVSNDGKTMTSTANGTDSSGRPVHNVTVWDKQP
jgi:hypothetical protein